MGIVRFVDKSRPASRWYPTPLHIPLLGSSAGTMSQAVGPLL